MPHDPSDNNCPINADPRNVSCGCGPRRSKKFLVLIGIEDFPFQTHAELERTVQQCIGYQPEGGIDVLDFVPQEEERNTPITADEYALIKAYRGLKNRFKST